MVYNRHFPAQADRLRRIIGAEFDKGMRWNLTEGFLPNQTFDTWQKRATVPTEWLLWKLGFDITLTTMKSQSLRYDLNAV